ncbi:acyltransferase [Asticcacaulis sp. SL142]|uniref:acyltransferase family protein n=1 Tax=Asticcacaulis sp. SL142 TaxID=2995155 RepID=UPI00226C8F9C|nr:acyltransferase [Asticcacaulis sp. SL142]WAC49632.1 acyltransferase [Asticcacaulis sp. SL142]
MSTEHPEIKSEIKALTGLRGIAAIYVVLYHMTGHYRFPDAIRPFIKHGYISVDLFFILSGFVMALTYGKLFMDGFKWPDYKRFLWVRLARVYPLYLLMTVITAILIVTVLGKTYFREDLVRAILPNLTMTQAWGLANSIVRPTWSISTEWMAYLLFPPFVWAALRAPKRVAMAGAVISLSVLALIAFGPSFLAKTELLRRTGPLDIASSYAPGTMLRCLASFFIGLVAYRLRDFVSAKWVTPTVVAILALLLWRFSDIALIAAFMVLIMALSHDKGPVARAINVNWVHGLGLLSYAIYLIHDAVLYLMFKAAPPLPGPKELWLIISMAVIIGLSALAHYGFEVPSRRYIRRFIK